MKLKRFLCILLSILLVITMLPTAAFAAGPSKTQEDALNWVRSQVGQVLDFDSMYGAQCTDLIMYYYRFLGYSPYWGNGCDYASGDALRYGWSRLYQAQPQPGDILVYEAGPLNLSGHVAIYESDYVHYHQNVTGQSPGVVRGTWYYNDPADYDYARYWGVIRPAWSTGSGSSDDYGYRITLDANGGTVSPGHIFVTDWYRNLPKPTRPGYTFYSWSVDKTSNFLSLVDDDWRVTKCEDHTLYAIWEPCWYTVSFDARGGAASESKRNIAYNSTYGTLPTATRSGYRFQGWFTSASGGSQVTSSSTYKILGNQTLYAHWEQVVTTHTHNPLHTAAKAATQTAEGNIEYWHCLECGTYFSDSAATKEITWAQTKIAKLSAATKTHTIKFDAGGGIVSESQRTVSVGNDIGELPVPTRTGYRFLGWYIMPTTSSAEVTSDTPVNQVTLPDGCTLYAQWEVVQSGGQNLPADKNKPTAPSFTDVPNWCAEPVAWAVEKGVTNGYGSSTIFKPSVDCTHAQILTMLWRAAGKPASSAKATVTVASSYADAVNWAYGKRLIDGSFRPDAPCTRSEAVQYIWQVFNSPLAKTSSFTDVSVDASYAKAVDWAVQKKITNGYGGKDTFAPNRVCNRGEIVTFLYRAYTQNS